ncbi:hypothetical protein Ahia01_001100200 [Argonauta hians]
MSSKEQTLSDDMEDEKMAGLRKNLLDEFLENQTENVEKLKVYLRVRPFTAEEKQKNHQTCLSIDGKAVTAHAPKDSHTYKNNTYITNKNVQTFMFSRIFDEDTAQAKFYSETCEGLVKNFLTGQNCLVFAYGVTNSGKTYTVQGSQKEPGILPRTLETIFSHVSGKLWDRLDLKPKLYSDVIKLSPRCELEEKRKKEELLGNLDESDNQSTLADSGRESCTLDTQETSDDSDVNEEDLLRSTQMEDSTVYDQLKYSVWVSFAEVYNEQVFDLLENPGSKKRNNLKLGQDKKGNHYIRGLTEVPVSSMEEAQKVLALGQKNLHKAATKLNHSSSRSHCIFNIKLLQFVNLRSPSVAKVSMLSLCDLAGSERTCKTQSTGDRLKEAGNINTSLLTLGQCIKTMRNNQIRKECQLVPYRNSKLTCLFQGFFNGHGEAIMIVNVNKCSKVFDETLQVFKFSAIAKQVVIQKDVLKEPTVNISPVLPVKTLNKLERVSIPWADDAAEADSSGDESFDLTEREAGLLNIIEKCKSTIAWLKEKLDQVNKERLMDEVRTREEITKEMMKHFVLIEKRYDEKMRASQQEAQDNADKWAAKLLTKAHSNKRSHDEMEAEEKMVPLHMLEELQKKNQECEFNIEKLKQQLESTRVQMRRLTVDRSMLHSEKTTLQLQLHAPGVYKNEDEKSVGDNIEQANVLNKLTSMLKETQEKLGKKECAVSVLEEQLEEAGEEFKLQLDKIEKLEKLVEQLQSAPPPECKVCLERCDTNTAPGGLLTKGRQQQQQHQQDQAKNSGTHTTSLGSGNAKRRRVLTRKAALNDGCPGTGAPSQLYVFSPTSATTTTSINTSFSKTLSRQANDLNCSDIRQMVMEKANESRVLRLLLNKKSDHKGVSVLGVGGHAAGPTPTKTSLMRLKKFSPSRKSDIENSPLINGGGFGGALRGGKGGGIGGRLKEEVKKKRDGLRHRLLSPLRSNLGPDKAKKQKHQQQQQDGGRNRRRSSLVCNKRTSLGMTRKYNLRRR